MSSVWVKASGKESALTLGEGRNVAPHRAVWETASFGHNVLNADVYFRAMVRRSGHIFVGREHEKAVLARALDDAALGNPRVVMIAGEPGIGKTALCSELAGLASDRQCRLLSGQCYEQGSLKLPYLPFVEAISEYAQQGWPHGEWSGTSILAEIVPALAKSRTNGSHRGSGSPHELFEAVSGFLRIVSQERSLVLTIEDLQDADEGSLEMLAYLGRRLGSAAVVIVGTYRDTDVDPGHPLSATLATLRRIEAFERIRLRGLSVGEISELYERFTSNLPGPDIAEAIHLQTEGNPLFASETLRHLRDEGLLEAGREAILRAVPEGLRDVIGQRILKLSDACQAALTFASVLGREFQTGALERLCRGSTALIDEAIVASVVQDPGPMATTNAYRFSHMLFQHYLYSSIPSVRRDSMHVLAARALIEVHAASLATHADAIASHLMHSTDATELSYAAELSESAAKRAFAVHAYAEAARLAQRALDALERSSSGKPTDRSRLLLLLASAFLNIGKPHVAILSVLEEAFLIAEVEKDEPLIVEAALLAVPVLWLDRSLFFVPSVAADAWAQRLDRYAPALTPERVYADVFVAQMAAVHGRQWESAPLFERARDLAWSLGNQQACWFAGGNYLRYHRQPAADAERKRIAMRMLALPRDGVDANPLSTGFIDLIVALIEFGERGRAESVRDELVALARATGAAAVRLKATWAEHVLLAIDGQLGAAVRLLMKMDEELGADGRPLDVRMSAPAAGIRAMLHLGIVPDSDSLAALPALTRASYRALSGDIGELQRAVAAIAAADVLPSGEGAQALALEHVVLAGDRKLAAECMRYFEGSLKVVHNLTMLNRLLGEVYVFLGNAEDGRRLLERGLEQANEMCFRPEMALCRVSLASLLLDHFPSEAAAARAHLDQANLELREMAMRPALERAERLMAHATLNKATRASNERPASLTEREVEVLRMVAAGRTNRQISDELVLSIRTVERHIANIYVKIAAHNKVEATSFAIQRGLT